MAVYFSESVRRPLGIQGAGFCHAKESLYPETTVEALSSKVDGELMKSASADASVFCFRTRKDEHRLQIVPSELLPGTHHQYFNRSS